jgi:hypothetical protein
MRRALIATLATASLLLVAGCQKDSRPGGDYYFEDAGPDVVDPAEDAGTDSGDTSGS